MKLLFVGDVVGKPGRRALGMLEKLIAREHVDFTVVNIENAAGGVGVTAELFADLSKLPIDVFTSGNHIWDKKDFVPLLDDLENLLRPANYPPGNPGRGWAIQTTPAGIPVGVLNLQGQVFMANTDSTFRVGDSALAEMLGIVLRREGVDPVLIDGHVEGEHPVGGGRGFGADLFERRDQRVEQDRLGTEPHRESRVRQVEHDRSVAHQCRVVHLL